VSELMTMTCEACGATWQREVQRGARPKRCAECNNARRVARAVPTMEGGVAVHLVPCTADCPCRVAS